MSILGTFQSLLQRAYWRGIPFYVDSEETQKGRKVAIHDYPYRDGGWAEDLGRRQQIFRIAGHLVGDLAPLMQIALDAACELPGPGLLIHPTLGAMRVALLSASSSVHKEEMRVIRVEFTFIEQQPRLFPNVITNTIKKVIGAVSDALLSFGTAIAVGYAAVLALSGVAGVFEGSGVTSSFASSSATAASDPAGLVGMATALPTPDADTSYGRYAAGGAITELPTGTTVVSLQAQLAVQRQTVNTAGQTAIAAATALTATTAAAFVAAVSDLVEAVRATMSDPADQIRVLIQLATFSYRDSQGGTGLSGDVATVRDGVTTTCRRCTLTSLSLAASAYQPRSYDDAVAMRTQIAAALDIEITAAGDAGDDTSYLALKALRAAVIEDLTARAAALPLVMTVTLPTNLPSLVVAYRIYRDTGRADQVTSESGAIHPAFLPTTLQVLAA